MRIATLFSVLVVIGALATSEARSETCNGQTREKVGPNGKTVTICLDGTKATCIRDGMKQGHSKQAATDFCNRNPRLR